jgi:soluble lytic murein transglycosylase-like protein
VLLVLFPVVRPLIALALAGLLVAPAAARGGEQRICSFQDDDGVWHFTNVGADSRCRPQRVGRKAESPVYARVTPVARSRPLPASEASTRYREHVKAAAQRYNLPEALLLAVMAVESNFDHRAVSEKGAMGLMQLMPGTARDMYVSNAYEPAQNIEGGARYLRILANQYQGDVVKTLAAYNAGPEAVRRAGDAVPDIPETREYVRRVMQLYTAFRAGR